FLFCGDIEDEAVRELLRREKALGATVLLVPHHGAFMEAMPLFLQVVRPQYAVISVGVNSFGHPRPETLAALGEAGVKTFRTDLHGSVIFHSCGRTLRVETMQKPALAH
ncbi:MAG TPA: MBL fold metallo-hydrolase, partial [Firmicutes bacterium]|nr:MBL fold metallo-hydrolase [Bacillota bacterium]